MNKATQKRPGGQDDRSARKLTPIRQRDCCNPMVFNNNIMSIPFGYLQVVVIENFALHSETIQLPVGLGARPANRRSLSSVEQAELDAGGIRNATHQSIKSVNLPHKMALAKTADRGIAGHNADCVALVRNQCRSCAKPSSRAGGLAASMATADYNDIKSLTHAVTTVFHVNHAYLPMQNCEKMTSSSCSTST
jgi:hypothetical protein